MPGVASAPAPILLSIVVSLSTLPLAWAGGVAVHAASVIRTSRDTIDFIDMDERRNRQKVMQTLEEELKYDRAPSKVLQFNDFGLVAITRKRVKQSLERTLGTPCPYCTGAGFVKSVSTMCNEIYVEM